MLIRLRVERFRNLTTLDLDVPAGLIAVVGPNGAGKTNLLEAIAVLGNLQSFRPTPPTGWVRSGQDSFDLAGVVIRSGAEVPLRQRARIGARLSRTLHRGARRLSPAEYLDLFPVASFSAHDRQLVWGGPEERRRLLDRVAYALHTETLGVLQRYRRALRQRNALLSARRPDAELEPFETELARTGARVITLRGEALAAIEAPLWQELSELGWSLSRPVLRYHAPDGLAPADAVTLAARLRAQLARLRPRERARGHTAVGPHRHDMEVTVAGAPAREMLSAGQGKLLATALKLAAMSVHERTRGRVPTVVFDDVDAELDARVLERIVARLSGGGQALISSAHEEMLLPRLPAAAVWRVVAGSVHPSSGEGAAS